MPFSHEQEVKFFDMIKDARFDSREITYAEKQKKVCEIVKNTFKKNLIVWLEGTRKHTKIVKYWENHEKCVESFFFEIIEKEKALKNCNKEPKQLYHFLVKCFSIYLKRENHRINNDERGKHPTISLDSYFGDPEEGNEIGIPTLMLDGDPQAAALKNELLKSIKEMIEKQKHRVKLILKLHYEEGLTYEEIAKLIKISVRRTKGLISPFREKLINKLSKYFNVKPEIFNKVSTRNIIDNLKTLGFNID